MPSLRLDDDHTIQAIGILADVLDRFSGVTSLECTLVSKALRQVQQTRSQIGMDFASRAFATLEPEIRRHHLPRGALFIRQLRGLLPHLGESRSWFLGPPDTRRLNW